ncbi:glycosyltransferase [Undibacterium arcticum]
MQSLFQGTLVAQGAFSIYDRQTLIEAGGWPDCVGEDIVLTWAILKAGHRIGHSEEACLFYQCTRHAAAIRPPTAALVTRHGRGLQAASWHPVQAAPVDVFFVYWNLLFPALDFMFTVFFIPGLILGLFGHYYVVGPMTIALLPIALLMNFFFMFSIGKKRRFTKKST